MEIESGSIALDIQTEEQQKKAVKAQQVLVRGWYETQDILKLVAFFFNQHLERKKWKLPTETQIEIVKGILYGRGNRILISAHTRYGKSQWVGIAVALRILFSTRRKIFLVAPTNDKTKILRDYLVNAIMDCQILRGMLDGASGDASLKKEVSKSRMTFTNGCMVQTLSAEGDGQRLMGWGLGDEGGDLIVDELAEIKRDVVDTKIIRMLADNPAESNFIGLFNPWQKDSAAYSMWISGDYKIIHINWEQGIKENRITQRWVNSQRKLLTPNHFQVLWDSIFPDEEDSALMTFKDLMAAKAEYTIGKKNHEVLIGVDVAEEGIDKSVITVVGHDLEDDIYKIVEIKDFSKQDTMTTTGYIVQYIEKYHPTRVNIDATGLGRGVYDRLIEQGYDVIDVKVGRAPTENKHIYLNQKAQMYENLRRLFEDQRIKNLNHTILFTELNVIKKEIQSNGKTKIIDPSKSPDFADSLAMCIFDSSPGFEMPDDDFYL